MKNFAKSLNRFAYLLLQTDNYNYAKLSIDLYLSYTMFPGITFVRLRSERCRMAMHSQLPNRASRPVYHVISHVTNELPYMDLIENVRLSIAVCLAAQQIPERVFSKLFPNLDRHIFNNLLELI